MSFVDRAMSFSRQSRMSRISRSIAAPSIRSVRSTLYGNMKVVADYEKCLDLYLPSPERLRNIDNLDDSWEPSYTDFKVPYHIVCEKRYSESRAKMERQFHYEFKQLLDSMESAYEAARFVRHMCITTFWPPLHNRTEIIHTQRKFFKLSKKQQSRLDYIMSTNII